MRTDPNDPIIALSTAPGAGARAIARLSGSESVNIISALFKAEEPLQAQHRRLYQGSIILPGVHASLPAEVYVWPPPQTYTGQLLVEIHAPGSPPLVDLLISCCLSAGARPAGPGEFTMRAFLAGKLDLTRAEAVLAVIEAGSRDELKQSLAQLAGGVARPLQELRNDLLNLLADVEAALDFGDEEIQFVQQDDLLHRLTRGLALLTNLRQQLDRRALSDRPFRVVLAGKPNAGKSSLFNALGGGIALVSPVAGTTRDYLVQRLNLDGARVDLIDTAGLQHSVNGIEGQSQELGQEQLRQADLILLCVEAGKGAEEQQRQLAQRTEAEIVVVATKCDLHRWPPGLLATSAATRQGLDVLRKLLKERAADLARPALAPSLARCRHHVDACLENLRRAHHLVLEEEPAELLALEIRGSLDQLGEMVGAVYSDDLLDRIFSRFCIGK
jgi:tRNA modification GTPase